MLTKGNLFLNDRSYLLIVYSFDAVTKKTNMPLCVTFLCITRYKIIMKENNGNMRG